MDVILASVTAARAWEPCANTDRLRAIPPAPAACAPMSDRYIDGKVDRIDTPLARSSATNCIPFRGEYRPKDLGLGYTHQVLYVSIPYRYRKGR